MHMAPGSEEADLHRRIMSLRRQIYFFVSPAPDETHPCITLDACSKFRADPFIETDCGTKYDYKTGPCRSRRTVQYGYKFFSVFSSLIGIISA